MSVSEEAYLGLGSNEGNRLAHLRHAMELLERDVQVVTVSSIYETEPVGFEPQRPFLNAVCRTACHLSPEALLGATQRIERELGRVTTFRNGPRVIDIDILLCGGLRIDSPTLVIPHPRMHERLFVLVPLAEIAPDLIDPASGRSIRQLLGDCGDAHWVRKANGGDDVPTLR